MGIFLTRFSNIFSSTQLFPAQFLNLEKKWKISEEKWKSGQKNSTEVDISKFSLISNNVQIEKEIYHGQNCRNPGCSFQSVKQPSLLYLCSSAFYSPMHLSAQLVSPSLSFKCYLRVDFATREEAPCGIIVSASRQPNRTCFLAQAPTGAKSIGIYISLGRRKANETLTIGVNLTVDPFLALRFPFGPFQCSPSLPCILFFRKRVDC